MLLPYICPPSRLLVKVSNKQVMNIVFFFVALEHLKRAKASRKKKHMAVHFVLLSLETIGLIDIFLTTYPSNVREK
jgi:hypothetical protein